MKNGKITVTPDGRVKALDTSRCVYVYLENKLVDEYGDLTIYVDGDHRKHYCFFDLTNDPVADTAKKLRMRHGRTKDKEEQYTRQADTLENKVSWYSKIIAKFHN